MKQCTILAALSAVMVTAAQAIGAVVITHSGSTDPTTESPAWTASLNGTGTAGSGVTHLGEPAWKLTDPSGGANGAKYNNGAISTADFDDPSGWTLEWRMSGENLKTLVGDDEATMRVFDGHYAFAFILGVNGTGASDGATLRQRFGAVTLKSDIPTIGSRATGFHTFALDFNPSGGLYRLFYDGSLLTDSSATPSLLNTATGSAILSWGGLDGNTADGDIAVDSFWNYVQLRTGTVPEPSSLAMILSAALPILWRKR